MVTVSGVTAPARRTIMGSWYALLSCHTGADGRGGAELSRDFLLGLVTLPLSRPVTSSSSSEDELPPYRLRWASTLALTASRRSRRVRLSLEPLTQLAEKLAPPDAASNLAGLLRTDDLGASTPALRGR